MTRFKSLGVTDFNARNLLRDRLELALHASSAGARMADGDSEIADLAALELLSGTAVHANTRAKEFETRYEAARSKAQDLPDFAEAKARGWFQIVDGDVHIAQATRDYVTSVRPRYEATFLELREWSWKWQFTVHSQRLQELYADAVTTLQSAEDCNFSISARTPAWVAARLWDEARSPDLWDWTVKWRLLGAPQVTPSEAWSASVAADFNQRALDATTAAGLGTWSDFMDVHASHRLSTSGDVRAPADQEKAAAPPTHLLGKYLAKRRPAWVPYETSPACLVALRCVTRDLSQRQAGPLPYPEPDKLVRLAATHPQVLDLLCDSCYQDPRLLADLLMHPLSAMTATYLIATWRPQARNEQEEEEAQRELRVAAFTDAARAIAGHVLADDADPEEIVELLVALQATSQKAPSIAQASWERRMSEAVGAISSGTPDLQAAVLNILGNRASVGVGSPAFAVLCEVMSKAAPEIATKFHPALLTAYQKGIAPGAIVTDLEMLSDQSSYLLVKAFLGQGDSGLTTLSKPLHVEETIAAAGDETAKFQAKLTLASSLRAHIRILARATVTFGESAPSSLVDALVNAINTGALAREEKGQVAAFSPFIDTLQRLGRRQRPIADEVAQAACRLGTEGQRKVVGALLRTDEPSVLAELSERLPHEYRQAIEQRVAHLAPDDAGHIGTLPDLQHTIQKLLDAGLTEAADRFIAIEASVSTFGPVPGRGAERFRMQLHSKLIKKQYAEILSATVPDSLKPPERDDARQALDHFQGLVYLEEGAQKDAVRAQTIFYRLATKWQHNKSYATNLLAARVALVLPTDIYAKLTGTHIELARHALAEQAKAIAGGTLQGRHHAVHSTNVAILQLSLGDTSEALSTLRAIEPEWSCPEAIAVEAVARARQGLPEQALQLLRHAEVQYGKHVALIGATKHIVDGAAYIASAQVVAAEESVGDLRQAFARFKSATPHIQAEVLAGGLGVPPIEALLTGVVRDALASLANLVPVLHLHRNLLNEDALNTLVRESLRVQLSPLHGWTVADQSRGGFTPSGGVGERDIVIAQQNTELAVLEGMKYSTSGRSGVKSHLQKITAYARCEVFFHIVYSHVPSSSTVVETVRAIATQQAGSLTLKTPLTPLRPTGNQPDGFVARYEDPSGRRVAIVFLIVDLSQHGQRTAIGAVVTSPSTGGVAPQPPGAPTPF